jgi:hypothetical protein
MQLTTMTALPADRQHVSAPGLDNVLRPPALVSVELDEGEEVEWIWTHYADGRSVVSGYRIVHNLPSNLKSR